MARPSAASLNSLAKVLRQAQPLYRECRTILNYLDKKDEDSIWQEVQDGDSTSKGIPANKDAACTPLTVFERKRRYGGGIT